MVNWTHYKGMLPNLKPVAYVFYNVYNYSKITNWTVVSCCLQLFGSPTSPNFHAFLAHRSDAVRCGPMRSDAVISHTPLATCYYYIHVLPITYYTRNRPPVPVMDYGLFAPKTIRSREQKFQVRNFCSLELLLPVTFAPWNFRSPTNECSKEW